MNHTGDYSPQGPTGVGTISLSLSLLAAINVLAFGGHHSAALLGMQLTVCVLAAWTLWRFQWPALPRPASLVLAILLAVPLAQVLPLPEAVVAVLSPARAAIARDVLSPLLGPARFLPLTVSPHATLAALLNQVCYVLVFCLAFYACSHRRRQPALVALLIALGCFEAAYGIFQYLTGWHYIFTFAKPYHTAEATGTYINRNHFAGLLEMALPFALAGILLRLPAPGGPGPRRWVHVLASPATSRTLRDVIIFSVMCVALIFSRSRMGIAAALVGGAVAASMALLQTSRRSRVGLLLFVLLLPAAYALWIGLTPVLQRVESGLEVGLEEYRLPVWRDTLALIRDYPLLGSGLGTFRWTYIHYQTHMFDIRHSYAVNDYLQFAEDLGVPVALLLFGSLWTLAVKVARRATALERTRDKILAGGCAGALIALLTHSLTDFNLQNPANAFLFAWIAGTAAALLQRGERAPWLFTQTPS